MTNEEKILEMLTQMQGDISGLKTDVSDLKTDVSSLKAGQDQMQDEIHRINAYLELDVEKRFDAVNEGINAILEKMFPVDRVEKLEDDVVVLKTAFKMLAQDVAELKKAQ